MKRNDYVNAIDHLKFDRDLAQSVRAKAGAAPRLRTLKLTLLAAVLACFMITTAFGAISPVREHPGDVETLGVDAQALTDAEYMTFTVSDATSGVEKHYMELDPAQRYAFRHGMLRNGQIGYLDITRDYQLAPVQMERLDQTVEKAGRSYYLDLDYLDMGSEVISNQRSVLPKNENGEILLDATDGTGSQWPFYFHVESGTVRDALPDWTAEDFEGLVGGAHEMMGGLLLSTLVNQGQENSRNNLYWIAPGAAEAKTITLPGEGQWYAENDTVYFQNEVGQLYAMDEDFGFQLICQYKTMDYLQDGLLTVSVRGKLGILDAYTGELYVFDTVKASRGDTIDYHALRYGKDGTIALTQTEWRHDPERRVLCSLGVLNEQNAQLNLLTIENEYDGYHHNWLDENRLAVVYQSFNRQFLCVYEFEN